MGIFDFLVPSKFRQVGPACVYYPWGAWGKGYLLRSEEDYQNISRFECFCNVAFPTILIAAVVVEAGAVLIGVLMASGMLIYVRQVFVLIRNLPVERSMTRKELKTIHSEDSIWELLVKELISIILTSVFVILCLVNFDIWSPFTLLALLYGYGAARYAYKIYLKIRGDS